MHAHAQIDVYMCTHVCQIQEWGAFKKKKIHPYLGPIPLNGIQTQVVSTIGCLGNGPRRVLD